MQKPLGESGKMHVTYRIRWMLPIVRDVRGADPFERLQRLAVHDVVVRGW